MACGHAPGQSEVFQGPLEALVSTWQNMPISLCAQASPYVSHKVYHLHRDSPLCCMPRERYAALLSCFRPSCTLSTCECAHMASAGTLMAFATSMVVQIPVLFTAS